MWGEINTFIGVQHLSRVWCLVNSCSLTISQKNQNQIIIIISIIRKILMLQVFKIAHSSV